jgi:hypothetical protein
MSSENIIPNNGKKMTPDPALVDSKMDRLGKSVGILNKVSELKSCNNGRNAGI